MKKLIMWIGKVVVSGFIALAILSLFCMYYYSHGIRKTSETGATDYSWENRVWSLGYEGHAWGIIDEDGYNNPYTIDKDDIEVLIMGSSQMNANNVSTGYSTAYLLNDKFKQMEKNYEVYNIGMEGHDFFKCVDNLDEALKTYNPKHYVIIESFYDRLSEEAMDEIIKGTRVRGSAYDSGLIYYLQKVPYFRLLHRQIRNKGGMNDIELVAPATELKENKYLVDSVDNSDMLYEEKLDTFFAMLSSKLEGYDAQLIIFYIPVTKINEDGSLSFGNSEDVEMFKKYCKKYDIIFADLTDSFREQYSNKFILPYGFSNTEIGTGHLNKYGHQMIAEKLFNTIIEYEANRNK